DPHIDAARRKGGLRGRRDVLDGFARLGRRDARLVRLEEYGLHLELLAARLPDRRRTAEIGPIALVDRAHVDPQHVARSELPVGRLAAEAMIVAGAGGNDDE